MEIKEGVIRLGRRPRRITPSEIATILHMIRKPNSMIALLFIQSSSSDVALRVIFLLFLLCFYPLFRPVPAVVLTLETSEVSAILVFTTKTTQSRPQVFSVNGALTCRRLHFWHFLVKDKILPNLVVSNWLWWIMCVLLANQNWGDTLKMCSRSEQYKGSLHDFCLMPKSKCCSFQ